MKLLGWNLRSPIVRAAAPVLPKEASDIPPVPGTMPPFGTNPPARALVGASPDLGARQISSDPRDLWYLSLPAKLTPKQVLMILRSALGGDVWQQWQLMSLMMDGWPMLRKCAHEIRGAVSTARWTVQPWAGEGEDPTPLAIEKRDLVSRCIRNIRPDPATDESGFQATVYDIMDAKSNGLSMLELMWLRVPSGQWAGELRPRASAWVHPRHFTFDMQGRIAVFDAAYNRLTWGPQPDAVMDANKFILAQYKSRSGSSLGAGLIRPLAMYWVAVVFNLEWAMGFAQKFGAPFMDFTYKPGTSPEEVNRMNGYLESAGANGYMSHLEGSVLNVHPAQSIGPDNAQMAMMKLADEMCQILYLGQTATTKGTPGKLGGEKEHADVKREVVEYDASWAGSVLTEQLATAIVRVNYGDEDEVPAVKADFTENESPMEVTQRIQILLQAGLPQDAEEVYELLGLKQPDTGDKVVVGGRIGVLGSTDEEIDQTPPAPPQFGGDGEEDDGEDEGVQAKRVLERAVRAASTVELEELRAAVKKARHAPTRNGEWDAVRVKVRRLCRKGRRL